MFFKDFTIEKTQEVKVLYTVTEKEKDLSVMKVDLEFKDGENPEPLTLKWREIPDRRGGHGLRGTVAGGAAGPAPPGDGGGCAAGKGGKAEPAGIAPAG